MKQVRARVKELTGRNRCGIEDVRVFIRDINPVLRGWGTYFRTGNAAEKFIQVDDYVYWRLRGFLAKRHGRNLHAGRAAAWARDFFARPTACTACAGPSSIRGLRSAATRTITGKPCAGDPHARFERGS